MTHPRSAARHPGHQGAALDLEKAPVVVFWETTRACALRCLHCRAEAQTRRNPDELTTKEGFALLDDFAAATPAPVVILTGGDPFMRPDVFDLLSHGLDRGLRMSLSPSVTPMVTRDRLAQLRALGLSRLSFSLDGGTATTHDAFRGAPGSFQRTFDRVQDALDVGLSLQVNTTIVRGNVDELPVLAERLAAYPQMALWDVFFLVPTGRGKFADLLPADEHERVYNWLYQLSKTAPYDVKTTLGQPYRRVAYQNAVREGADPEAAWSRATRAPTNDGKGVCFVSHVGQVFPSGFLPLPCGNVRETPVLEIYRTSPVFRALRDSSLLKGKCGRCAFRAICGGTRSRAYAVTGDYLAEEPCCVFDGGASDAPMPPAGRSAARLPG